MTSTISFRDMASMWIIASLFRSMAVRAKSRSLQSKVAVECETKMQKVNCHTGNAGLNVSGNPKNCHLLSHWIVDAHEITMPATDWARRRRWHCVQQLTKQPDSWAWRTLFDGDWFCTVLLKQRPFFKASVLFVVLCPTLHIVPSTSWPLDCFEAQLLRKPAQLRRFAQQPEPPCTQNVRKASVFAAYVGIL